MCKWELEPKFEVMLHIPFYCHTAYAGIRGVRCYCRGLTTRILSHPHCSAETLCDEHSASDVESGGTADRVLTGKTGSGDWAPFSEPP